MKSFFMIILLITSVSTFAKMNKIKPKNVTCAFLQNKVYHEKELYIKATRLGGVVQIKEIAYSEDVIDEKCPARNAFGDRYVKEPKIVATKDVKECNIGFRCRSNSPSW